MARVYFDHVTKKYGNTIAVREISFEVPGKSFVVIVGPSGCGKTTSLRMVAGLEKPTDGNIYIGDEIVNNVPPKDRDIAMVFQNYALYPHKNVFNNLAFGLVLRKYPKEEIKKRVYDAAGILGISELLDRKPAQLSGGQRQRVAMGRAIVRKPRVFLFDEPLSNLDAKLRVQMRAELIRLHEKLETTTVYVTHDQIEAMTLAEQIVVMDKGRIIQIGGPMEIYNHPKNAFVAGFIGSPTINLIEGHLIEENGTLFVRSENFKLAVPESLKNRYFVARNQEVILGIRPERFYVKKTKQEIPGYAGLKVITEVIEPIGSGIIVLASCGTKSLTVCLDPESEISPHAEIELFVDMNRMLLFEKASGKTY